ncbi:hypothetical protein C8R42DRAFT_564412, partial [Lentinula raphanica]
GQPKRKANQIAADVSKLWKAMSKEEREEATKDHLKVLRDRRENKESGTWHNADISANHDSTISTHRIKEELQRLHSRTGDESILVIVRGGVSRFHPPECFTSSDRVESFLAATYNFSSEDLCYKMDAYMVLGVEGVARSQAQELQELKRKTAALILRKLQEAGGKHAIKSMYYVNFEDHITRHYGIVVKNWPLSEFRAPGSFCTRADLNVLFNSWNSGTTYFHKMTEQEYRKW